MRPSGETSREETASGPLVECQRYPARGRSIPTLVREMMLSTSRCHGYSQATTAELQLTSE